LRFLVAAPFLPEADRSSFDRDAAAAPPFRPPFSEDEWFSAWPRPEPDFLPPPFLIDRCPGTALGLLFADAAMLIAFLAFCLSV
jgi:hypothetical protein